MVLTGVGRSMVGAAEQPISMTMGIRVTSGRTESRTLRTTHFRSGRLWIVRRAVFERVTFPATLVVVSNESCRPAHHLSSATKRNAHEVALRRTLHLRRLPARGSLNLLHGKAFGTIDPRGIGI